MRTCLLILLCCPLLPALEVHDVRWGFGGSAVVDRMNPLTLTVRNQGSSFWEGRVELRRGRMGGGARFVRRCTLAPGQRRVLQFVLWVGSPEECSLRWREGDERLSHSIPAPRLAPPQAVYLDEGRLLGRGSALPHFPDAYFPQSAAACDALDAVLLDHRPEWAPARRRAFLDWLRGGGVLLLAHGVEERWPRFGPNWPSELDDPDAEALGAGRIIRYSEQALALDRSELVAGGYRPATAIEDADGFWMIPDRFLPGLREAVDPDHAWELMLAVIAIYLLLLFPGQWLLARRFDYRVAVGAGALLILGCAWLLAAVGSRGYGERMRVDRITHAVWLGGNRFDCSQWGSCFVTEGERYRIAHAGGGYFDSSEDEAADPLIDGDAGGISLEIPLYSSASYLARAVLEGPDTELRLQHMRREADGGIAELVIAADFGALRPDHVWALHEGRIYRLRQRDGQLRLRDEGRPLTAMLDRGRPSYGGYQSELHAPSIYRPLIAYSAGGGGKLAGSWRRPAPSRLRLLAYVDADPHFAPADLPTGERHSTLYQCDLILSAEGSSREQ